jgi:retinol dehydrogenase 12
MPSFSNFLYTQLVLKIPEPSTSFDSKTVIVTGANGGLGKESVKHIIRLGASKVICGCRSQSRGNKAKQEIEKLLRCSTDIIEVWEIDIESPSSTKRFVDRVNALPRLDVVINNAGIRAGEFKTVYDTEHTVAVNVIGTFLLALQLVPKLRETARTYRVIPHMTFVGSALYDRAKYPEDDGGDIFTYFKDKSRFKPLDQ